MKYIKAYDNLSNYTYIVYHGSDKYNIKNLKKGSWVTEHIETAKSFGKYLYKLNVYENQVDWEYLSPNMIDWDTNGNGEWRGTLKYNIKCNKIK